MCSIRQTVAPLVQELVVDGEEDDKTYLFKKNQLSVSSVVIKSVMSET